MFLERIVVFTFQLRAKLRDFFNYLLKETDSQIGQIFLTIFLLFLTALLFYVWIIPFNLWLQIGVTVIYLFSVLLCVSAIYFFIRNKRIRVRSNSFEVYKLQELKSEKTQLFNLRPIPENEEKIRAIFKILLASYLVGNYESFQSLIQLKPIATRNRLKWIDLSPKRPKQVNRQTLLEFLDHLFVGFKDLNNKQIILFVEQYFIFENSSGTEQQLSTKNVSDWRTNEAEYLKEISHIFKNL